MKKRNPKRMVIKTLLTGFIVVIALFVGFSVHHIYDVEFLAKMTRTIYNHPFAVSNAALMANSEVIQMHRSMTTVLLQSSPEEKEKTVREMEEFRQKVIANLDIVASKILGEEGKALERKTRVVFAECEKHGKEILRLIAAGNRQEAAQIISGKNAEHMRQVESLMLQLSSYAQNKAADFMENAEQTYSHIFMNAVLLILAGLFLSTFIIYVTVSKIMAAEEEIQENFTFLQEVIEGIDDPIWVKDAEKRYIMINSAATRFLEKNCEQVLGNTNDEIFPWRISVKLNEYDKRILNDGGKISFEEKITLKDEVKFFNINQIVHKTQQGEIKGVIGVLQDITEKKHAIDFLQKELLVNTALSELYHPLTEPGLSISSITNIILLQALKITDSEFGYVATVDPETKNLVSHTLTEMFGDQCKLSSTDPAIVFERRENGFYNGLWGHSLNTKEAFFSNSPENHISSRGIPKGHIEIKSFLSCPVLLGGELVGQISVANKTPGYNSLDLGAIKRLGQYFALAIQRRNTDQELQVYQADLEKKVEERTNSLLALNKKLAEEISERKEKALALKNSEQKYSTLVENAIVGILIIQDEVVVYANPRLTDIFGYSVDEFIGMGIGELIHDDARDKFDAFLMKAEIRPETSDGNLIRAVAKDRKLHWIDMRKTSISYKEKPALLINMLDVSRRKELEYLINVQDKMTSLGRIAAGIAHELRNPLSGMNIHLSNLQKVVNRFGDLEPDQQESLTRIIDNLKIASSKIESVVKRVYDFAKPSMYNIVQVDVNRSIENVMDIAAASLRKKGIAITRDLSENLPQCRANKNLFEQLLMNLITNSSQILEVVDTEKTILIKSSVSKDKIVITVADSGPGIPASLRDKIFDPFFTSRKDGLGIGLSICYRIVQDHGGELTLGQSEELGGAEFTITLPPHAERSA